MNPKLLYQNYALTATITASSEKTTLPATNLNDPNRQKVWRSNGVTAGVSLIFDFGSAKSVEALAMISSNLRANAVVGVRFNSANVWTGVMPYRTLWRQWLATNSEVNVLFLAAAQSYRYMRLDLDDSGNPDGYLEVGVAYPSPVLSLPTPAQALRYGLVDPSPQSYAPAQSGHVYELPPYVIVDVPFRAVPQATLFGALQTAMRECGRRKHVVLSMYSEGPNDSQVARDLNLYGLLVDLPGFDEGTPQRFPWSLRFRECL